MKIFLLSFLLLSTQLHAQYNFESCIEFWKLADKLKSGSTPSEAEWEALRLTEGYKRKNVSPRRWKEFTDKITLAFLPGKEEELLAKAKTDLSFTYIIQYARQEEQLKNYMQQIEPMHLLDSALLRARKNLPAGYQNCCKPPVIYFILYDYDGSASNQQVIIDLLISLHMDTFRTGLFTGHEIYHYISSHCRIKQKRFRRNPAEEHYGAFLTINAISEEGTADLVDKKTIIFDNNSPYLFRDTFNNYQRLQAPACIQKINDALEKLSRSDKDDVATTSYWMQLMPWAAHIPGTFMSNVMRENGFEKELIESADNAFSFFYIYNKAAMIDPEKTPIFSKEAIRFLRRMERKYIR